MTSPARRVRVTLVEAAACHFCVDARRVLEDLVAQDLVDLQVVDATSPTGTALVARHRAPMFPLVLVDDELFSSGRLPRRKLAKRLGMPPARVAG